MTFMSKAFLILLAGTILSGCDAIDQLNSAQHEEDTTQQDSTPIGQIESVSILTASSDGTSTIEVTWKTNTYQSGLYNVYYSTSPLNISLKDATKIEVDNLDHALIKGLSPNSEYYIRVADSNDANTISEQVTASTSKFDTKIASEALERLVNSVLIITAVQDLDGTYDVVDAPDLQLNQIIVLHDQNNEPKELLEITAIISETNGTQRVETRIINIFEIVDSLSYRGNTKIENKTSVQERSIAPRFFSNVELDDVKFHIKTPIVKGMDLDLDYSHDLRSTFSLDYENFEIHFLFHQFHGVSKTIVNIKIAPTENPLSVKVEVGSEPSFFSYGLDSIRGIRLSPKYHVGTLYIPVKVGPFPFKVAAEMHMQGMLTGSMEIGVKPELSVTFAETNNVHIGYGKTYGEDITTFATNDPMMTTDIKLGVAGGFKSELNVIMPIQISVPLLFDAVVSPKIGLGLTLETTHEVDLLNDDEATPGKGVTDNSIRMAPTKFEVSSETSIFTFGNFLGVRIPLTGEIIFPLLKTPLFSLPKVTAETEAITNSPSDSKIFLHITNGAGGIGIDTDWDNNSSKWYVDNGFDQYLELVGSMNDVYTGAFNGGFAVLKSKPFGIPVIANLTTNTDVCQSINESFFGYRDIKNLVVTDVDGKCLVTYSSSYVPINFLYIGLDYELNWSQIFVKGEYNSDLIPDGESYSYLIPDGAVSGTDPNSDKVLIEGNYVDGLLDGKLYRYNDEYSKASGSPQSEFNYVGGELSGQQIFRNTMSIRNTINDELEVIRYISTIDFSLNTVSQVDTEGNALLSGGFIKHPTNGYGHIRTGSWKWYTHDTHEVFASAQYSSNEDGESVLNYINRDYKYPDYYNDSQQNSYIVKSDSLHSFYIDGRLSTNFEYQDSETFYSFNEINMKTGSIERFTHVRETGEKRKDYVQNYKGGLHHGEEIYFTNSDANPVSSVAEYHEGKFSGNSTRYESNGTLLMQSKFSEFIPSSPNDGNDDNHGYLLSDVTTYYSDGAKRSEYMNIQDYSFLYGNSRGYAGFLNDNKPSGTFKEYANNGDLWIYEVRENGWLLLVERNHIGTTIPNSTQTYSAETGLLESYVRYSVDGYLEASGSYNENGEYILNEKLYYWDQVVAEEYRSKYVPGGPNDRYPLWYHDGLFTSYHLGGQVESRGMYVQGKKTGSWEYYDYDPDAE